MTQALRRRTRRHWIAASLATAASIVSFAIGPNAFAKATLDFDIRTLSTRPDTVTGGDVLIEVAVPQNVPRKKAIVFANGTNITSTLHWDESTRTLTGLVTGLRLGANEISASSNGNGNGRPTASLAIANYPITGPVFSGPHETPFKCETTTFGFPDGTRPLGSPLDADCSIATRVDYFYRSSANTWKPLTNLAVYPADLITTTTNEGKTVPFIIRLETGTVNRAIYQTAMLDDPKSGITPGLFQRSNSWNGRLVFQFGGGCTGGWYRQGSSTGGVTDTVILGMGYAMASSSLNVFGNNCNDLLTSESLMMTKERFIETYGVPTYTIGFGCSGGSYQQHQAADNYPGLLDGIIPGCSFPEVNFATVHSITDARLIGNYFLNKATVPWTDEQKRQVVGFYGLVTMTTSTVYEGALRISPTGFCPSVLPVAERYNPLTNPGGARCDVYDHAVNVFGRDPVTHFALRPLDNVGIQYGLAALKRGTITVDQFLDLNEKVGGYDFDGNFRVARTVGDTPAIRAAYRSGRLTNGGGGLRDVPIIDYRAYADDDLSGNIHLRYHSFSMRERLKKANGDADNQVMLVEDSRYGLYSSSSPLLQFALRKMDQWIANIQADDTDIPQHQKVVRDKPADLNEGCNTRAATPTFIAENQTRDPSLQCEVLYPSAPAPREVAGASIAGDVIKCQSRSINPAEYPSMTATQFSRLQSIFPAGVCDWSQPGIEQQPLAGAWQFF
ncbi:MAG TPA: DUF6351 family protein [Casimicrobiaceae bacterium]